MNLFRTWRFEWWEVSLLKICLLTLGMMLVFYFPVLGDYMPLWWMLFAITAAYFVIRLIREK